MSEQESDSIKAKRSLQHLLNTLLGLSLALGGQIRLHTQDHGECFDGYLIICQLEIAIPPEISGFLKLEKPAVAFVIFHGGKKCQLIPA